jgi:diguanylate cyclase (GGDEF)-like protein
MNGIISDLIEEDLLLLQEKVTMLPYEGKYKETIEACNNLLEWGMTLNDPKSVLIAHLNLAASHYSIGYIEEAFKHIDAHLEICSKFGDETDKLNLYHVLFLIYDYNKDFTKAKATLEKSIELGKELKNYNIVSNGYNNYSQICIVEENYEIALQIAKEGMKLAKLNLTLSPIVEIRLMMNMAKAYIGLEDFNASRSLIKEIMSKPILEVGIREKAQFNILIGSWYAKQKLYGEAFELLTYAKELVEGYNDIYLLKEIQEERCKLCEQLNDFHLGYKVQKEYISLLKEISNQELALEALKLDIKHGIADLEKKANNDYLTGLYNRNYIETITNEWLNQAYLKNESIVCIVFDIDHFKLINDQYGHLFGDEVIKHVGKACSNVISEQSLFGRYGGDEFVAIIKDVPIETGEKLAEQIEHTLRNLNMSIQGKSVSITVSIGVSSNTDSTVMTFNDLFHVADVRLYKAKQNGRNQIFVGN